MLLGCPPAHIRADFGKDVLCQPFSNASDRGDIDTSDADDVSPHISGWAIF
jgi:hypothetical protein